MIINDLWGYCLVTKQLVIGEDSSPTLEATDYKDPVSICYSVDCRNLCTNKEISGTLQAKSNGGFSYNYLNPVLMENKDEQTVSS